MELQLKCAYWLDEIQFSRVKKKIWEPGQKGNTPGMANSPPPPFKRRNTFEERSGIYKILTTRI